MMSGTEAAEREHCERVAGQYQWHDENGHADLADYIARERAAARAESAARIAALEKETERLHALLDDKAEFPCASDQASDVDYWRMKAGDHFFASVGASDAARASEAKLTTLREEAERALREIDVIGFAVRLRAAITASKS
jgi:hypothetical protein